MNPPANLPFEPLTPPPAPAQGSASVPPPPPTPPRPTPPPAPPLAPPPAPPVAPPSPAPAPAPAPSPKPGVAEPEDIFSNMEKPGGAGMSPRPFAAAMPEVAHHVSYGRIFAIIAIVLLVVTGAGFAFWWFVIRTPAPVVPAVTTP